MYLFLLLAQILLPPSKGNVIGGDSLKKENIIGGQNIDISEAPHMVSLIHNGGLRCGGSILDEYNVLTAAHCLIRFINRTSDHTLDKLVVRSGSSYFDKGGSVHHVETVKVHEKFEGYINPDYDVGLIRVKEPIEFGKNAKPIPLPEKPPETGKTTRISGWGETKVNPLVSKHLQSAQVEIVDWAKCSEAYPRLTQRMICASRPGIDSCQGDSGGGMDYNGTIVGIVSFGRKCADPDYPGVYTNVADPEILDYIKRNLN